MRRQGIGRLAVLCGALLMLAGCGSGQPAPAPRARAAPLTYRIDLDKSGGAPGYVFYTTGRSAAIDTGRGDDADEPSAAVISDRAGHIVWRHPVPRGQSADDFRTQTYQGHPVLTWWQGQHQGGHGIGTDYIADEHYNIIETLTPGGGLSSDAHEFRLTPDGRALITSYKKVTTDLSSIGGPRDAAIYDCIAAVVDVATKKTLVEWDALQHVPVADTDVPYRAGQVLDPYHMNSLAVDPSGNLLVGMRAVSTIYDVDQHTGAINWQLGGKHSTFALGAGVQFAYQHDAQMPDPATITLFDNDADPRVPGPKGSLGHSSLMWIHLDPATHTATLVRRWNHPGGLVAQAMGNLQELPGGNTFSGWGTAAHISEFSPTGAMLYDVTLPAGGTYRAFLNPWSGRPATPPRLTFTTRTAHALWNGATGITHWRLLHGSDTTTLTPLTTVAWTGHDTAITLPSVAEGYFQLQALDRAGAVVAETTPTTP